jgi:hypothetical protein
MYLIALLEPRQGREFTPRLVFRKQFSRRPSPRLILENRRTRAPVRCDRARQSTRLVPRPTKAVGNGERSMQPLMRDQPQPPCHAPKNNSAERHDTENDRAK